MTDPLEQEAPARAERETRRRFVLEDDTGFNEVP